MNAANRIPAALAAAPALIFAAPAPGQSGTEPQDPVESFAGRELAGYGYGEHFCWPLADTAYAQAEALAAAMGETRTPVYTFELHTGQRWDMCLWRRENGASPRDWEAEWKYRNCDFARDVGTVNGWIHHGRAHPDADHEYAEYDYPDRYGGGPRQDETIVYAGPIADRMICADAREPYVPARAELLIFRGDTRPDGTGGAETE